VKFKSKTTDVQSVAIQSAERSE